MAKTVAKIVGCVFIATGVWGFFLPDLLGANLNSAYSSVHIISGGISLYFGFAGSISGTRIFNTMFGAVYLLLGVNGVMFGEFGPLMLGRADVAVSLVFGCVLVASVIFTSSSDKVNFELAVYHDPRPAAFSFLEDRWLELAFAAAFIRYRPFCFCIRGNLYKEDSTNEYSQ